MKKKKKKAMCCVLFIPNYKKKKLSSVLYFEVWGYLDVESWGKLPKVSQQVNGAMLYLVAQSCPTLQPHGL